MPQSQCHFADPYVKVNLMQQDQRLVKWKTTIRKNTVTPVFYESTQFDVAAVDLKSIHFDVLIMDHDRVGRNGTLGIVKLGYKVDYASGRNQWQYAVNNPKSVMQCLALYTYHSERKVTCSKKVQITFLY